MPVASRRFLALRLCVECDAAIGDGCPPPFDALATVRKVALNRRSGLRAAASAGASPAGISVVGLKGGWSVPVGADGFVARGDIRRVMVQSLRLQIESGDLPYDPTFNVDEQFDECWSNTFASQDGVTETGMTAKAVQALVPGLLCDRRQAAAAAKSSSLRSKARAMVAVKKKEAPVKKTAAVKKTTAPPVDDWDGAQWNAEPEWDGEGCAWE